jgi:hypothetical protein
MGACAQRSGTISFSSLRRPKIYLPQGCGTVAPAPCLPPLAKLGCPKRNRQTSLPDPASRRCERLRLSERAGSPLGGGAWLIWDFLLTSLLSDNPLVPAYGRGARSVRVSLEKGE